MARFNVAELWDTSAQKGRGLEEGGVPGHSLYLYMQVSIQPKCFFQSRSFVEVDLGHQLVFASHWLGKNSNEELGSWEKMQWPKHRSGHRAYVGDTLDMGVHEPGR